MIWVCSVQLSHLTANYLEDPYPIHDELGKGLDELGKGLCVGHQYILKVFWRVLLLRYGR